MKKLNFQLKLSIIFLREGNRFIAHSPALDLSTSGKNFKEAKKRFDEAAEIFFEEIVKSGTINEVLGDLGWKKSNKKWQPPIIVSQESETISVPVAV